MTVDTVLTSSSWQVQQYSTCLQRKSMDKTKMGGAIQKPGKQSCNSALTWQDRLARTSRSSTMARATGCPRDRATPCNTTGWEQTERPQFCRKEPEESWWTSTTWISCESWQQGRLVSSYTKRDTEHMQPDSSQETRKRCNGCKL